MHKYVPQTALSNLLAYTRQKNCGNYTDSSNESVDKNTNALFIPTNTSEVVISEQNKQKNMCQNYIVKEGPRSVIQGCGCGGNDAKYGNLSCIGGP